MSRTGLGKRLASSEAAIREHDPLGHALHNLSPKMREGYESWREECAAITSSFDNAYEALLNDALALPPMPKPLADALCISDRQPTLSIDCSVEDAALAYQKILDRH